MTPRAPLICIPPRRFFSDRLDGAPIPWWARPLVALHLAFCPGCRRVYRSLEATEGALRRLGDSEVQE